MLSPQATEPNEKENEYFGILNLQLFLCPCHNMKRKCAVALCVLWGNSDNVTVSIFHGNMKHGTGLVQSLVTNSLDFLPR